jgi:predicted porin
MLQYTDTTSPKGQMLLNDAILSTTGEGSADARRIARFENLGFMLNMGIDPQPKTDEEKQHVQQLAMQQQQQPQEPDAMMVAAMAEQQKAMAEQEGAQNKRIEIQSNHELKMLELNLKAESIKIDAAKFARDKSDKYNVDAASIQQNQQKIELQAQKQNTDAALSLTKLEMEAGRDLNAAVQDNMLVFDPAVGDFI